MVYFMLLLIKLVFLFSQFYVCGFANDNKRVKKFAVGRTRFMIMSLTACYTRIAVGDCRDGILFYAYHVVCDNILDRACFFIIFAFNFPFIYWKPFLFSTTLWNNRIMSSCFYA